MKTKTFADRHIGIEDKDLPVMLKRIGVSSLDELIDRTIPSEIRLKSSLPLAPAMTEREFADHIASLAGMDTLYQVSIRAGWDGTATPASRPTHLVG